MEIIAKGQELNLDIASKQETGSASFYFGAGWDNPNGPVDLDMVIVALRGGKLTSDSDLAYYAKRDAIKGVFLSEDNQTGDGDGDDEHVIVQEPNLDPDVDGLVIGLACYSDGVDFANAPNPHFRVCDGDKEDSPQIADVPAGSGKAGDTVLVGFHLTKGSNGEWSVKNDGLFYAKGNGVDSIKGFGELFK